MAANGAINVYGIPELTPEELNQKREDKRLGIVRHHIETYLEMSVPIEIEKELEEMIDKRLDEFYSTCPCEECKRNRK